MSKCSVIIKGTRHKIFGPQIGEGENPKKKGKKKIASSVLKFQSKHKDLDVYI